MKLKEKINMLMEAMKSNPDFSDMVEDVNDVLATAAEYVKAVANEEASIQMARIRLNGPDFRTYVQNLDQHRRARHEALMVSMNMLNRVAKILDVEPPFDVYQDDRESYYAEAKNVVDEYFTTGPAGSATATIGI